jgi:hypothetical protein
MTKQEALAKHLGIEVSEVETHKYDDRLLSADGNDYLVMTDDEANDAVRFNVEESAWAFNAEFIAGHTKIGLNAKAVEALKKMQAELSEDANDLVLAMIDDLDHFAKDAVKSDGRGHFLSGYDGEEIESGEFFIYRQ